jgi:hypothetical protein
MGTTRSTIDDIARRFIEAQHIFFVASGASVSEFDRQEAL